MRLSQQQRTLLFAGECPKFVFPGSKPCPVPVGYKHVLSDNVWLEVTEIRRTAKGDWSLVYTLYNQNLGKRYLAPQNGQLPNPELNYSRSPSRSIDREAGEAVDEFTQNRLTKESRARESDRKRRENEDLMAAMTELQVVLDSMDRNRRRALGRTLWILRSRLDAAQKDLKRREVA